MTNIKQRRLSLFDKTKNYFSNMIMAQLLECISAYKDKRPQLTNAYRNEALSSIEIFGLFAWNMNMHGQFAKMAQGSVRYIEANNDQMKLYVLHEFYDYLFKK